MLAYLKDSNKLYNKTFNINIQNSYYFGFVLGT